MKILRSIVALVVVWAMASGAAFAQQTAGGRTRFWSGAILGAAGGAAIALGTTALKSERTTSGNTPRDAYVACVSLKSNPVYRGNDCEVLKGPNTALVIGGAIAAATGATLMMLGLPNSSVHVTAGGVSVRHRVKF